MTTNRSQWKKPYIIISFLIIFGINLAFNISRISSVIDTSNMSFINVIDDISSYLIINGIFLFIPNILLIGNSIIIYNCIDRKNESSGRESGRRILATIVTMIVLIVSFAVAERHTYMRLIKLAKEYQPVRAHAPVIYIYNDNDTRVNIGLELNGELTAAYPRYIDNEGWTVSASSDGTLTDDFGNRFDYIYWEADLDLECDLSHGFCIPGNETESFLTGAAHELGLNDVETTAFVGYWTPVMKENPYNVISFQTTTFDEAARMNITPKPDVIIRVNMLWYPSDEYIDIEEQTLSHPESNRHGLTVVEWGGEMLPMDN